MPVKFRQFVQKQHAIVRQADFSGPGYRPAADQTGIRNCMVRSPERTRRNQSCLVRKQAGNRVDLGGFNRLVETHRRQNSRKPARQHGLTGTRRPDQHDVVPAGHRHFHRALRLILPFDVFEIDVIHALLRKQLFAIDRQRNPGLFAIEQFHYLRQVSHGECPNPVHYSSLACIGLRND